jgi:phosphate transport system permease protein
VTTAERAAGDVAAAHRPAQPPRRSPPVWRAVDAVRAQETTGWRWAARAAAVVPLAALVFAVVVLAVKGYPAIKVNGAGFFTKSVWKEGSAYATVVHKDGVALPQGAEYGAWPVILGTLQTAAIALVLAVPISIGCAFALTERLPRWVSQPLGFTIELLAGIPSVVLGLWAALTLGPIFARHVYPVIADHMPDVPVLRFFRPPVGHGEGLLTGGLILTLMVVPIVTATTRDLFRQVPALPKEGGEALGMTDWEVGSRITIPWVRSGIIGASALGLGRAIGETIAVAMATGTIFHVAPNVYSPMSTMAAWIVTQLDSALTDCTGFAVASMAELALVLAVLSVLVNLAARWIVRRSARRSGLVGSMA